MKKTVLFFTLLLCFSFFTGCGVSNILHRGEYVFSEKSVSAGAPRSDLLAKFGSPIETKKEGEAIVSDVFRVPQGETTTGKISKGVGLLYLDLFTVGLAEIWATPATERKDYVIFEVQYDKDQQAKTVKVLRTEQILDKDMATKQDAIDAHYIRQQEKVSEPVKPPLLAQSAELGERIGVIIKKSHGEKDLKIPGKGSTGRGAAAGATIGASIGSTGFAGGSLFGFLLLPITTTLGAAGGAVYGAASSEDASKWVEAEATFRASFVEIDLGRLFEERLITFSEENGYMLDRLKVPITDNVKPTDYVSLSRKGISLVLELSEFTIELRPVDDSVADPSRRLVTSVRCRVIRTVDGSVQVDRVISDADLDRHKLDEWMLSNGLLFRRKLSVAPQGVADAIVTELILLHPLPERVKQTPLKGSMGLSLPGILFGPAPVYPPPEALRQTSGGPYEVDSVQPTLRWEPFQGSEATYDLKVWVAGGFGQFLIPKELLYSRENLKEPHHTIEIPLQPTTWYVWTVRAKYKVAGQTRLTGWGMWTARPSNFGDVQTLGLLRIITHGSYASEDHSTLQKVGFAYYSFRTP